MLYDSSKFLLISGPCSLEGKATCKPVAERLVQMKLDNPGLNIIFKGSFDKANRTSLKGDRGVGMQAGLELLAWVREEYKLPVATDIHLPEQAKVVGAVCDVLQIPAFLCRQTDLLVAAAGTGSVVHVKKGQFLSPYEMQFVVEKLRDSGAAEIWQTDRGTAFGYQNLIVDMRSFSIMKRFGTPVLLDATHSVQLPGADGGKSGGQREFVEPLACAACAAGADGLFIETHPDPERAISDGPSQVPLKDFPALIDKCFRLWRVRNTA